MCSLKHFQFNSSSCSQKNVQDRRNHERTRTIFYFNRVLKSFVKYRKQFCSFKQGCKNEIQKFNDRTRIYPKLPSNKRNVRSITLRKFCSLLPTMKQMTHSMDDIRKQENKNVALFHRIGRWTAADPRWLNRNEAHAFQRRHRNCIRRDTTIEIQECELS